MQDYRSTYKEIFLFLSGFFVLEILLSLLLSALSLPINLILLSSAVFRTILLLLLMYIRGYKPIFSGTLPPLTMLLSLATLFLLNMLISLLFGTEGALPFTPAVDLPTRITLWAMLTLLAFFEELLYRALLLEALQKAGSKRITALFIAGLLFAIGHIYLGVQGLLFALSSAFVLGWLYHRSGGLWAGFIVHLVYNLSIVQLAGFIIN